MGNSLALRILKALAFGGQLENDSLLEICDAPSIVLSRRNAQLIQGKAQQYPDHL
jgi:hypothetical protein